MFTEPPKHNTFSSSNPDLESHSLALVEWKSSKCMKVDNGCRYHSISGGLIQSRDTLVHHKEESTQLPATILVKIKRKLREDVSTEPEILHYGANISPARGLTHHDGKEDDEDFHFSSKMKVETLKNLMDLSVKSKRLSNLMKPDNGFTRYQSILGRGLQSFDTLVHPREGRIQLPETIIGKNKRKLLDNNTTLHYGGAHISQSGGLTHHDGKEDEGFHFSSKAKVEALKNIMALSIKSKEVSSSSATNQFSLKEKPSLKKAIIKKRRYRDYEEHSWNTTFDQFVDFCKVHGHALVPHTFDENPCLARWVKRQRRQYKLKLSTRHSTLTDARMEKLNTEGFIWNSHAQAWKERFKELQDYKHEHGHCSVPVDYPENRQLAIWVKQQRRQYKLFWAGDSSTTTTIERIGRLVGLGFSWENPRASSSESNDLDGEEYLQRETIEEFGFCF